MASLDITHEDVTKIEKEKKQKKKLKNLLTLDLIL